MPHSADGRRARGPGPQRCRPRVGRSVGPWRPTGLRGPGLRAWVAGLGFAPSRGPRAGSTCPSDSPLHPQQRRSSLNVWPDKSAGLQRNAVLRGARARPAEGWGGLGGPGCRGPRSLGIRVRTPRGQGANGIELETLTVGPVTCRPALRLGLAATSPLGCVTSAAAGSPHLGG